MKRLFEIVDYNKDAESNLITVEVETNTSHNRCYLPLTTFENWLNRTDRLNWIHDWSDQCGSHCQETGKYSINSYWEMANAYIKADIYDFIVIHFVNPFSDIPNAINQITKEYARV
jgi:hypothetical protein